MENPTQSNEPSDRNFDKNLLNDLKIKFLYYHDIYKNLPFRETQVNYNKKGVELQLMNCIKKDFINYQKGIISLWIINVIQYSEIIALLDHNNTSKELTDKNEKTPPRNKCSTRGKVNNNKLTLLQLRTKLKTFGQVYGKKKQVLKKKPHGLRHLKIVIARTRDLRIISLRNKYLIAC